MSKAAIEQHLSLSLTYSPSFVISMRMFGHSLYMMDESCR